jgi:hypothetical protein
MDPTGTMTSGFLPAAAPARHSKRGPPILTRVQAQALRRHNDMLGPYEAHLLIGTQEADGPTLASLAVVAAPNDPRPG